jgi:tRNA(Ile)-lysidine synthase
MLNEAILEGRKLLLAVSGGSDSMALFHLLKHHPVATVNHALRAESFAEAEQVRDWTGAEILTWEGEKPATGIQAAARNARYDLLVAHALNIGAEAIVTAHTLDDQAETVMMRFCRGSSPLGLAGMAAMGEYNGFPLLRPLLWATKADLREFLGDRPFIEDPSNQNEAFTRVRMRAIMPQLAGEGLTSERVGRFAARQGLINDALDFYAEDLIDKLHGFATPLQNAPFAVVLRVLSKLIASTGDETIPERLEKLEEVAVSLLTALAEGEAFHATLRGTKITLTAKKTLSFTKESPRSS